MGPYHRHSDILRRSPSSARRPFTPVCDRGNAFRRETPRGSHSFRYPHWRNFKPRYRYGATREMLNLFPHEEDLEGKEKEQAYEFFAYENPDVRQGVEWAVSITFNRESMREEMKRCFVASSEINKECLAIVAHKEPDQKELDQGKEVKSTAREETKQLCILPSIVSMLESLESELMEDMEPDQEKSMEVNVLTDASQSEDTFVVLEIADQVESIETRKEETETDQVESSAARDNQEKEAEPQHAVHTANNNLIMKDIRGRTTASMRPFLFENEPRFDTIATVPVEKEARDGELVKNHDTVPYLEFRDCGYYTSLYKVVHDSFFRHPGRPPCLVKRRNGRCKYGELEYREAPTDPRSRNERCGTVDLPCLPILKKYTSTKREVFISTIDDFVSKDYMLTMARNLQIEPVDVVVFYHPKTGEHMNMAFMLFRSSADASKFVTAKDGALVAGCPLRCCIDPFATAASEAYETAAGESLAMMPYLVQDGWEEEELAGWRQLIKRLPETQANAVAVAAEEAVVSVVENRPLLQTDTICSSSSTEMPSTSNAHLAPEARSIPPVPSPNQPPPPYSARTPTDHTTIRPEEEKLMTSDRGREPERLYRSDKRRHSFSSHSPSCSPFDEGRHSRYRSIGLGEKRKLEKEEYKVKRYVSTERGPNGERHVSEVVEKIYKRKVIIAKRRSRLDWRNLGRASRSSSRSRSNRERTPSSTRVSPSISAAAQHRGAELAAQSPVLPYRRRTPSPSLSSIPLPPSPPPSVLPLAKKTPLLPPPMHAGFIPPPEVFGVRMTPAIMAALMVAAPQPPPPPQITEIVETAGDTSSLTSSEEDDMDWRRLEEEIASSRTPPYEEIGDEEYMTTSFKRGKDKKGMLTVTFSDIIEVVRQDDVDPMDISGADDDDMDVISHDSSADEEKERVEARLARLTTIVVEELVSELKKQIAKDLQRKMEATAYHLLEDFERKKEAEHRRVQVIREEAARAIAATAAAAREASQRAEAKLMENIIACDGALGGISENLRSIKIDKKKIPSPPELDYYGSPPPSSLHLPPQSKEHRCPAPVRRVYYKLRAEEEEELIIESFKAGMDQEDEDFFEFELGEAQANGARPFGVLHEVPFVSHLRAYTPRVLAKPVLHDSLLLYYEDAELDGIVPNSAGSARVQGYDRTRKKQAPRVVRRPKGVPNRIELPELDESVKRQVQTLTERRALSRRIKQYAGTTRTDKMNLLQRLHKAIKFAPSPIHGYGLYSLEAIAKDEIIIEYIGEKIRPIVADVRERAYERRGIGSSYLFKIDENEVIDATRRGNIARFINHSCEPNCYAKIMQVDGSMRVVILCKTAIERGDEITYDYKFDFEDDKVHCYCGAAKCKGFLN